MADKELTPEELKAELGEVREALKRVNAESAGRRKELEKIAAAEEERKKELLSETEKFQVEIKAVSEAHKALKAELSAERVRTAIIAEAMKLGFASPEDAMSLTNLAEITVTDGKVSGFEKSLKALADSGRLAMKDDKRSDGLGTPPGRGNKPPDKADKQSVPVVNL